jgi:hypothetical protein
MRKRLRTSFAGLLPVLLLLTLWRGAVLPVHLAEHSLEHLAKACANESHEPHVHKAEGHAKPCELCRQATQTWVQGSALQGPLRLAAANAIDLSADPLWARALPHHPSDRGPPAA